MLAAVAVVAACLGAVRPSAVLRRLEQLAPHRALSSTRRGRRAFASVRDPFRRRALAGCAIAAIAIGLGLPLLAPALGYATFIAPTFLADRRRGREEGAAERALVVALEWADALVSVGQPAERALAAAARQGTGAVLLDPVLRNACAAAVLGAPLFRVLAAEARGAGLARLAELADELDRARDLGRGSRSVLRDARDDLRRRERARAIGAASKVEGKLMLVLVCCYLPALMLAVVVPLFVGLLGGLLE